MKQTENLNVKRFTPITSPEDIKQVFPLSEKTADFVFSSRQQIKDILFHRDNRLMVVVGPCSIHDPKAALEYADHLAQLKAEVQDRLYLVMRVYFEKPRTTFGWKGLINDPDLNGTHPISKGLGLARQLLCNINSRGIPVANEVLDPFAPHFIADLISWGAIGARTTESQTHREMASGLSFPVGFKNSTDGNIKIALDAISATARPHSFIGINRKGIISIVETTGNPETHIVLRGGHDKPNYFPEDIKKAELLLKQAGLRQTIMVDCSHGNSCKDYERQQQVLCQVVEQRVQGNRSIRAIMMESNLNAGNQPHHSDVSQLKYGVSITDACLDWESTRQMLLETAKRLRA
jgi:3-deoxy-7-phosphoheptulonate synthase